MGCSASHLSFFCLFLKGVFPFSLCFPKQKCTPITSQENEEIRFALPILLWGVSLSIFCEARNNIIQWLSESFMYYVCMYVNLEKMKNSQ